MRSLMVLLLLVFVFTSTSLLAEFRPYGSARIGFWYENEDKDWSSTGESEMRLNYFMQGNSRFGARFAHGDLTGRVEFGGTGNMRLLFGKYKMNGWSLLIGQDITGVNQRAKQYWGGEVYLVGWGAIDEGRKQQIRIEFDNGFYVGLIRPDLINAQNANQDKDSILPKINLGYKGKLADDISFQGTFGLNQYSYNENAGPLDHDVISYIVGFMFDFNFDPLKVTAHLNYGQNTGNYGLGSATRNIAIYDDAKDEIVDVMTMGGFGQLSFKMSDKSLLTGGLGYVSSDSDAFDNADSAMAVFAQLEHRLHRNVRLIPEIGMLNKMKDIHDKDEGSMFYFGTQLRMDF